MRIALLQPPYPLQGSVAAAEDCLRWMRDALRSLAPGAQDLICLPEYANAPGLTEPQALRDFAENQGGGFLADLAEAARRLRCPIALAAVRRNAPRWVNQALLFDSRGEVAFSYEKVHLTDVEERRFGLTPGAVPRVFDYEGVRLAFAVCFDLYFAEYFEALAAQRVDVVLCPSYQRSESAERIRLIAQARALDSGAYVVRSSYAMGDPDVGGRSLIASPDGALLADAGAQAGRVTVEIDPKRKFMKPASRGERPVEHRELIESRRRPAAYRPYVDRVRRTATLPFPRLCAHRGLSEACPENTLPAFAAAIAAGAAEIELDLWMSRDGVAVVCHDDDVQRTTDGRGKIGEMDWADLRRLDAGIRLGEAWRGVRAPRLEETLDLCDGRIGLNIHVKEAGPEGRLVRRLCDLLHDRGLESIAYIAGCTEPVLRIAREYAPDVSRACLLGQEDPARQIGLAQQYSCQRIQFCREVTPAQIRAARRDGLICNLFWSDEIDDARDYVRNGIDVILTNRAHTLIANGFP